METEEIDIFQKIMGHNPSIDMSTPTTTPPMWFTVHHNRICGVMVRCAHLECGRSWVPAQNQRL